MLSVGLTALGWGMQAQAQNLPTEADPGGEAATVEEVVVTAQKREQRLQDVPLSIDVLPAARLDQLKISSVEELPLVSPSLSFTNSANTRGQGLSVRGVGTINFSDGVEPSVSTVIDGVVLGRQAMSVFELIDIERVEVLRGPQGTLFGKNASAGVLNIVTQRPSNTFGAVLSASYATLNEVKLRGSVSGPLGENTTARLTGYYVKRDGLLDNVRTGKDLNDRNQWGVRGKLRFSPGEDFDVEFIADYADIDQNCCAFSPISINPTVRHFGTLRTALTLPVVPSRSNRQVNLDGEFFLRQKSGGVSAQANLDLGDHVLTSITAFRTFNVYDNNDPDGVPINLLNLNNARQDQRQFTQEVRLTSPAGGTLEYVLGAFFFDQEVETSTEVAGTFGAVPAPAFLGSLVSRGIDTRNAAVFGELTFNVSDRLSLILGGRFTDERLDAFFFRSNLAGASGAAPINGPPIAVGEIRSEDTAASYRLGAQFDVTDDVMVFATHSRGYKGAAINLLNNLSAGFVAAGRHIVPPEIPTNYEAGLRTTWFDRRLTANATAFHTTFENFQATAFDAALNATTLVSAGELRTQGLELELSAAPVDGLSLFGNAAFTDAEFTEFPGGPCYANQGNIPNGGCTRVGTTFVQDLKGQPLNNAPRWAVTVGGNYERPIGGTGWEGFIGGNYVYRSEVNFSLSQDPNTVQEGFGLLNATVGSRRRIPACASACSLRTCSMRSSPT
jgi:iron complex outermembrane receptor protein